MYQDRDSPFIKCALPPLSSNQRSWAPREAKWPPFENGKSPTILLATALGSKSDSNTKETKTTDNFLDAVRARIAKGNYPRLAGNFFG